MYIKSVIIKNIRSIEKFTMDFDNPAGWHVIIGDNGTGKSTIIRSIAYALVGPEEINGIQPNWNGQLKKGEIRGSVLLKLERRDRIDVQGGISGVGGLFPVQLNLIRKEPDYVILDDRGGVLSLAKNTIWGGKTGWFSAGFGPFRRFTGGSYEMEKVFSNPAYTRLASHLSLFGEDVALTETTKWLMNLQYQVYERKLAENVLGKLKDFINQEEFLPHQTKLTEISSDGVSFTDGNGAKISVNEMSDGYRSILSLTFELIRQLFRVYGESKVFPDKFDTNNGISIDLPGVVLIDEVDAHLHPTWQTRIGNWFTKYFPNIQFIVTTHSPLVCRACEHGTVWRLAAPGSEIKSGEIKGTERDKVIFGNILDAYGTEIFGDNITISEDAVDKKEELVRLSKISLTGSITPEEEKKLKALQQIFATDDILEL